MSKETVEIVKANADAYNREDWDAFLKDVAPGFGTSQRRSMRLHRPACCPICCPPTVFVLGSPLFEKQKPRLSGAFLKRARQDSNL
jgi:hypothetical protein